MTPDVAHDAARAESLRHAMYHEAMSRTLESSIEQAEILQHAEERYCRAHMNPGHTMQQYRAYEREWHSHAHSFAALVREDREHPALKPYFTPDIHTHDERTWKGVVTQPNKNQGR